MSRTIKVNDNGITLNEYLSNYSQHKRNLDKIIKKWYSCRDNRNPKKTKEFWDKAMKEFFSETEK
jgi:hypothetical protein